MTLPPYPERPGATLVSALWLAVIPAVLYWLYAPGLTGPFLFDDFPNLAPLGAFGAVDDWASFREFIFGSNAGPLGRPVAMASFLVDDHSWPTSAGQFKHTNILIHALVTVCAFAALRRILAVSVPASTAAVVAVLIASIWALSPLHVSTVLYPVQRMAQLAALFGTCAVWAYFVLRPSIAGRSAAAQVGGAALVLGLVGLATLSKENGALTALVLAAAELLVFERRQKADRRWAWCVALLPATALIGALAWRAPAFLQGYGAREFSLAERLLTESRVLWSYAFQLLVPGLSGKGIFQDDYLLHGAPGTLIGALASIGGHLVLVAAAVAARRRAPLVSFGIAWWYAGHLLESTLVPLEIYFEHRNYFPGMGLILAAAAGCLHIRSRPVRLTALSAGVALSLLGGLLTSQGSRIWGNHDLLAMTWAAEHPTSPRAQAQFVDRLLAYGQYERGRRVMRDLADQRRDDAAPLLKMYQIECEGDLERTVTAADILAALEEPGFSRTSLTAYGKNLLHSVGSGRCDIPVETVSALVDGIAGVEDPALDRRSRAHLYYAHGEFLLSRGERALALESLERAHRLQPSVSTALRLAVERMRAGRYAGAREAIALAEAANSRRSPLLPSRAAEISRLRGRLDEVVADSASMER